MANIWASRIDKHCRYGTSTRKPTKTDPKPGKSILSATPGTGVGFSPYWRRRSLDEHFELAADDDDDHPFPIQAPKHLFASNGLRGGKAEANVKAQSCSQQSCSSLDSSPASDNRQDIRRWILKERPEGALVELEYQVRSLTKRSEKHQNGCLLLRERAGSNLGSIGIRVRFRESGRAYSHSLPYGAAALAIQDRLTSAMVEGLSSTSVWHSSHLCGNWICCNPDHLTIEPGPVNQDRKRCMPNGLVRNRHPRCPHFPRCLSELQVPKEQLFAVVEAQKSLVDQRALTDLEGPELHLLETAVICAFCHRDARDPWIVNCQHVMCYACLVDLHSLAVQSNPGHYYCPSCHRIILESKPFEGWDLDVEDEDRAGLSDRRKVVGADE